MGWGTEPSDKEILVTTSDLPQPNTGEAYIHLQTLIVEECGVQGAPDSPDVTTSWLMRLWRQDRDVTRSESRQQCALEVIVCSFDADYNIWRQGRYINNLLVVPGLSTCLVRNSFLDIVNTYSQTLLLNIAVTHTTGKCAFGIVDKWFVWYSKNTIPVKTWFYTSDIVVRTEKDWVNYVILAYIFLGKY